MTRIAFVGLGIMGAPMAANLVAGGYEVIGFDRNAEAVARLVELGGEGAAALSDAVAGVDVVLTMVPDSPDVEAVTIGDSGFYQFADRSVLHIDCSTIRPDVARRVAENARERGLRAVDAPVSGGEKGAIDATLSIMVGGSAEDVAAARPILETVGSTVVHVGPSGAGQTVKAANQLIVAGTIELVAEALVFLDAYGVDREAAVRVLAGGLAGNRILDLKAAGMIAHEFAPGFRVDLHHKDMGIVTSAAREAGVVLPLGLQVSGLMAALRAQGHGKLDHSALMLLVEQMSGRGHDAA